MIKYKILFISLFAFLWVAADAYANIVVRAIIVNPSTAIKRSVPFKTYLPKEIRPENIVDKGDLELAFDPAEGAYYVFKTYELDPKETVSVEVEMQDVWRIPQEELNRVRAEAQRALKAIIYAKFFQFCFIIEIPVINSVQRFGLKQFRQVYVHAKLPMIAYPGIINTQVIRYHINDHVRAIFFCLGRGFFKAFRAAPFFINTK